MTPNNEKYPDLYFDIDDLVDGRELFLDTKGSDVANERYVHESTIAPLEQRIKELEEELKTNKAIRAKLAIQSLCMEQESCEFQSLAGEHVVKIQELSDRIAKMVEVAKGGLELNSSFINCDKQFEKIITIGEEK